ncbi:hypothetical protein AB0451_03415 [Streptomyces sp. NPDC052000]|uniref:hypothetical protein n=1 Tax=Streptomyces sp. NPDC052000 TaxID=3155676 RepID=UPI00344B10F9
MTDQPTLRDRIADVLAADDGHPWDTLCVDTQHYLNNADAVLAAVPEVERAAIYRAAWHSARRRARVLSDDLTRRAPLLGQYAAAASEAEAHRLALSQVLGLGTGAPWDAIQERASELAVLPAPADRGGPGKYYCDNCDHAFVAPTDTESCICSCGNRAWQEKAADRAAVLAEVEHLVRKEIRDCGYAQDDGCDFCNGVSTVLEKIRRMADEAQQPEEAGR